MTTGTQTSVGTWTVDPSHSVVEFAVKHFVITTVKGRFRDFEATLRIDESHPENSSVSASVAAASVDTSDPDRDAHLRSDDFFNAERYPKITFRSTSVERVDDAHYKVHGDLTIRDVTKPVVLDTEFEGEAKDPWGGRRAAFTATTQVNRHEFGVKWNQLLETGAAIAGESVKITLNIEAVHQG